jgi:hypothetical protein
MILEGEGRVRLAAYDGSRKEFIDLGWHDAASLRGWTIADYDWRESDGMEAHPIDPR